MAQKQKQALTQGFIDVVQVFSIKNLPQSEKKPVTGYEAMHEWPQNLDAMCDKSEKGQKAQFGRLRELVCAFVDAEWLQRRLLVLRTGR